MAKLWRDVRLALRVFRKTPGMTAVALISLALGIGANTAIFSLLNAVLLRTLPVPHPEQLVALSTNIFDKPNEDEPFSWPMMEEFSRQPPPVFSDVFCWDGGSVSNYEADGVHYTASHAQASATYYKGMQVEPLLGRFIGPEDFGAGDSPSHSVAVISYRVWRHWFHGSSTIIGQPIRVGPYPYTVIGVEPEGFSDLSPDGQSDVTVPFFAPGTGVRKDPRVLNVEIFARLKPGVGLPEARAALQSLWPHILDASLPAGYAGESKTRFFARKIKLASAATGVSFLRNRFSYPLQILMGIVGVVLFIACLNIANLSLAKAAAHRHQSGVQAALGATTWDLVRPALVESLLLSCTGAVLGLMLAFWASHFLLSMAWTGFFTTAIDPSPDLKVLAFTAIVAMLTGVLFGIVPALYAARVDPIDALKRQSRSVQGGANIFGKALLVMQVALSLTLMLAALLFGRTISALHSTDVGYRRDHMLTLWLFHQSGVPVLPNRLAYFRDLVEKVSAIPGVESASYSEAGPASQFEELDPVFGSLNGPPTQVVNEWVGPGFFNVAGMHVLAGRDFEWSDAGHHPALISQNLAQHLFPNQNPIGRTVYLGTHAHAFPVTILGVVSNASLWKVESNRPMAIYQMFEARPHEDSPLMDVRTSVDPQSVKSAIEKVIRSQGHHYSLRTMTVDERLDSYITIQRLTALLSEFFGGVALLIACVGLYGLMSFHVTRRTMELGIRSALGADRWHLLLMVLREALVLAGLGCAVGVVVSLEAGRFVKSVLFGVSANDFVSFVLAVAVMFGVAGVAAYLPARRAAATDPMTALRAE
jgi:predicted permease